MCLESHRFTSPRQNQVSGKFQTPGQYSALHRPSCSLLTQRRIFPTAGAPPGSPPLYSPRGNGQKLSRALQTKSKALPCSTLEKILWREGRGVDTIPETWGSRAWTETARSKQIFLIKKSKSCSLALQLLEAQPAWDMKRNLKPLGRIRISHPHASRGFTGGGDWVSGGLLEASIKSDWLCG